MVVNSRRESTIMTKELCNENAKAIRIKKYSVHIWVLCRTKNRQRTLGY